MSSRLEGVADLTTTLNELGAQVVGRELKGTVGEAMKVAEHRARSLMPQGVDEHRTYRGRLVSPGFALQAIAVKTGINKQSGAAWALLGVEPEAFYAVNFVEVGTIYMAPQPWLRPAFEGSSFEMLGVIRDELKGRVEKHARRRASRQRAGR